MRLGSSGILFTPAPARDTPTPRRKPTPPLHDFEIDALKFRAAVPALQNSHSKLVEDLGNLELRGLRRPVAAFNVVQSTGAADA
jgi:hypothetical protein